MGGGACHHIFACTSGREGGGCTAALAALDHHANEVRNECLSVPSDELVGLQGTLCLHNATYEFMQRGHIKCNLGYSNFKNIPAIAGATTAKRCSLAVLERGSPSLHAPGCRRLP